MAVIHFRYSVSILKDSIKFNFLLQSYAIEFFSFPIGKIQTIKQSISGKREERERKEVNYLQTTRHSITLA